LHGLRLRLGDPGSRLSASVSRCQPAYRCRASCVRLRGGRARRTQTRAAAYRLRPTLALPGRRPIHHSWLQHLRPHYRSMTAARGPRTLVSSRCVGYIVNQAPTTTRRPI
jgi:hypothetical protein